MKRSTLNMGDVEIQHMFQWWRSHSCVNTDTLQLCQFQSVLHTEQNKSVNVKLIWSNQLHINIDNPNN